MSMFRRPETFERCILEYRYWYGKRKETLLDPGTNIEELFCKHFEFFKNEVLPKGEDRFQISRRNSYDEATDLDLFPAAVDPGNWYRRMAKAKQIQVVSQPVDIGYDTYTNVYFLTL